MAHKIEPIKITAKGETYMIKKTLNQLNQQHENRDPDNPSTSGWNSSQNSIEIDRQGNGNEQNNNWTNITHNKRRKISPFQGTAEAQQWLQDIPLSNTFSSLEEEVDMDANNEDATRSIKPPPIYVDANIIDPLIELLNHTAGTENYTIKQIKLDQVKIQTNAPETFRKVTQALRQKNAAYHTYQLKTEKSYKAVIRGLHPRTSITNIKAELTKLGHEVRTVNNMTKFDTKQPLPLFLIELEPRNNNKEIFNINKILNTIVNIEPPRHKKDIPQCIRCQQYGHTKNYCNRAPACVKCAQNHLSSDCPFAGKIDTVKCCNCNGNHPASYKGCEIRKQLQKKLFPPLRRRTYSQQNIQLKTTEANPIHNAYHTPNTKDKNIKLTDHRSYAQVTTNTVLLNEPDQNNNNDTTEIKELLKQSIKNSEILTKMIMEQNAILRQQTQQITTMLQLLTNTLTHK